MLATLDKAINFHEQALYLQSRRAQILASNLANADTPQFKAMDINFAKTFANILQNPQGVDVLTQTNPMHIQPENSGFGFEPMYRIPMQTSLDGNTVESETEMAAFNENSIHYLATLRFLNGKFNTLMSAIRGD